MTSIHEYAFGLRLDGGPDAAHFRVLLSRIRRALKRHGVPIKIQTNKGAAKDGDMTGTHTLIFTEAAQ